MRDLGLVRGNKESAKPITIGVDTVFLRFDIKPVDVDSADTEEIGAMGDDIWEWREFQLDLHEWLAILTAEMVDINSLALAGEGLSEAVQGMEVSFSRFMAVEATLSPFIDTEEKPFTFKTRFAQKKV